jgi:Fic family protein
VLALQREYADYKDRMERIPCSSRYPLSFVHKFSYSVPLPEYDAVRALHRSGASGRQRAKELCASGDVWLGYAKAYFAVPPPPAQGLLAAAIHDAQRAVNLLHDKFHLHRWPPRIDSINDSQTAAVSLFAFDSFRVKFNYHTNHIEGSQLSFEVTEQLLQERDANQSIAWPVDSVLLEGARMASDHDDAWGYMVEELLHQVPVWELREEHILRIHALVVQSTESDPDLRYNYRPRPMRIRNRPLIAPQPEEVPALMHGLVHWLTSLREPLQEAHVRYASSVDPQVAASDAHHPIVIAALVHLFFIQIHPFADGNGRTGRLLTNFIALSCGFPPINFCSDPAERAGHLRALHAFHTAQQSNEFTSRLFADLQLQAELIHHELIQEKNAHGGRLQT